MQKSTTKAIFLLLSMMMAAMLVSIPTTTLAATDLVIIDVGDFAGVLASSDNSAAAATESQWNYSALSQTLELSTVEGNYRLTGTNNSIVVSASSASGASITFDALHIKAPSNPSTTPAAFVNGNSVTITLVGVSSISATDGSAFQHSALSGCTITSTAAGTLTVDCNATNQAGFAFNDYPLNISGNATVNVQAAADAYGLRNHYMGGSFTLNVNTNAALSVTAGTAIWAYNLTLFVNGTVSLVGSSATIGFGYGILANNAITLSGNGSVTVNSNVITISTLGSISMSDEITLRVINNSSTQEVHSFSASHIASTSIWVLTNATFAGGTVAGDTTISVAVDTGDTGVVKRQVASALPVCKNTTTGIEYTTFAAAVQDAVSGETILLLTDVHENYNMTIDSKNLTIDMDGFDLNLDGGDIEVNWSHSLTVVNGGTIYARMLRQRLGSTVSITGNLNLTRLIDNDLSLLTVIGDVTADEVSGHSNCTILITGDVYIDSSVSAGSEATIKITGNVFSTYDGVQTGFDTAVVEVNGNIEASRMGIYSNDGTVKVNGNITAGTDGVYARDPGSAITITGSVTAGHNGVVAFDGASVEVKSGITTTNTSDPSQYSGVWVYGQYGGGAKVTVSGGITSTGNGVSATNVHDQDVTVVVNGNIMADFYGVWAGNVNTLVTVSGNVAANNTGVLSSYGSKVVVEGAITAPRYVVLLDTISGGTISEVVKSASQNDSFSLRLGFKQYSGGDPLSWVWVGNNPQSTVPTETPNTGDAAATAVASLLLLATMTLLAAALVSTRKRNDNSWGRFSRVIWQ